MLRSPAGACRAGTDRLSLSELTASPHEDAGDPRESRDPGRGRRRHRLATSDPNGDGFDETFDSVKPGTPVCFDVIAQQNDSVPATTEPQLYKAAIDVVTSQGSVLDAREVFFLVPPNIPPVIVQSPALEAYLSRFDARVKRKPSHQLMSLFHRAPG